MYIYIFFFVRKMLELNLNKLSEENNMLVAENSSLTENVYFFFYKF